jgi:hypothetical protein
MRSLTSSLLSSSKSIDGGTPAPSGRFAGLVANRDEGDDDDKPGRPALSILTIWPDIAVDRITLPRRDRADTEAALGRTTQEVTILPADEERKT